MTIVLSAVSREHIPLRGHEMLLHIPLDNLGPHVSLIA